MLKSLASQKEGGKKASEQFFSLGKEIFREKKVDLLLDRDSEVLIENVMKNLTSEAIENIIVSVCIN